MEIKQINEILSPIIWDYRIEPVDFYEVALGKKVILGIKKEMVLVRMLERLFWYDLIKLFGINELQDLLTPEIISKIRNKEIREKYEIARQLLRGEPVSISGWSAEHRKKVANSTLSNRWYRTEQRLFQS